MAIFMTIFIYDSISIWHIVNVSLNYHKKPLYDHVYIYRIYGYLCRSWEMTRNYFANVLLLGLPGYFIFLLICFIFFFQLFLFIFIRLFVNSVGKETHNLQWRTHFFNQSVELKRNYNTVVFFFFSYISTLTVDVIIKLSLKLRHITHTHN